MLTSERWLPSIRHRWGHRHSQKESFLLRFLRQRGGANTARAVEKTRDTWFGRVATLFRGSVLDDRLWDELEELLISADVGVATTQRLLEHLKERVRASNVALPEEVPALLKEEMVAMLSEGQGPESIETYDAPLVLLVVGVNGAGKTTSIAKLAQMYLDADKHVILGAADTFRAAAAEQLQAWGSRLGVNVIAHQPGADPGAVAFDTLQAARSRGADVAIIDTAGRLHTKANLMEELKKVQRVLSRKQNGSSQQVLLTLDATTGQNGLLQARSYVEALRCDGVFLAKLDGTAKGGMVLAIADELKLPVRYIGTGEQLSDIALFDPREFVEALFQSPPTQG